MGVTSAAGSATRFQTTGSRVPPASGEAVNRDEMNRSLNTNPETGDVERVCASFAVRKRYHAQTAVPLAHNNLGGSYGRYCQASL